MRINQELLIGLKPIYNTITFEIKKQRRKFIAFLVLIIMISILIAVINAVTPSEAQPETILDFYYVGLYMIIFLEMFAASLFFSAIICTEFDKKTGNIVFPKINKYKLIY